MNRMDKIVLQMMLVLPIASAIVLLTVSLIVFYTLWN